MQARALVGLVLALLLLAPSCAPVQSETLKETLSKGVELYQAGRYEEAEPLLKEALAQSQREFGSEDPVIASLSSRLALLYDAQGRYAEAEPLYKRAIALDEKALGPEHPGLATDLSNLAGLYDAQGRYAE